MEWFRATALFFCAAALQMAAQTSESLLQTHIAAAQRAQAHADCHLAAREYHAAVLILPTSGELRTNEGIALYCDQQLVPAIDAFNTALHLKPDLAVPRLFLGLATYRQGNAAAAERELQSYIAAVPNDVTAHLWLGYALAAEDRPAAAETEFQKVLKKDQRNLDAQYALGQAALSVAHEKVVELQALDTTGALLLRLAVEQYRAAGNQRMADAATEELSKRVQAATPQDERTTQEIDAAYTKAKEEQQMAQAAFAAILALAPDSYRAHEVLGDAALSAQQEQAAIPQYRDVIRLNPTLPGVHETLGECLMSAGSFAEGLAALNDEMKLSPVFSARLETRIGQAELAMGKTAEATEVLQRAIKTPTAPPQAYLLMGQVLLRQGRAAEAVPLLQRYLSKEPNGATAYYYLSRAYRALGDHAAMTAALTNYERTSKDAQERALTNSVARGAVTSTFSDASQQPEF